nr:hypothetical protein [Streptomyces sp. SID8379]
MLTAAAAVTAATVSGCVSVRAPAPPAVPSPSVSAPEPRPDGHSDDRPLVQGPAREALRRTGSTPHRSPAAHPEAPPAPAHEAARPPRTAPRPAAPKPAAPRRTTAPKAERPAAPVPAPPHTDVCALGRQYGGWDPDSPQSVICQDTYGS